MFSSSLRGPALSIQCTPVLTELTNKELTAHRCLFPQLSTALAAAFLHEGHTFHILDSNLYIIKSEKRVAKFSGEKHGEGKCGEEAQELPECRVTERASPSRPAPPVTTHHWSPPGHCLGSKLSQGLYRRQGNTNFKRIYKQT